MLREKNSQTISSLPGGSNSTPVALEGSAVAPEGAVISHAHGFHKFGWELNPIHFSHGSAGVMELQNAVVPKSDMNILNHAGSDCIMTRHSDMEVLAYVACRRCI